MTRWDTQTVRALADHLAAYREQCRPTTLVEVGHATRSPFHLLAACVISLRTKDAVTEEASARLFALADSPRSLAACAESAIAEAIYPAGFYRTKARQLRAIAELLVERHGGEVPGDEAQLLALPGVGRKTANLVLGLGFGVPAICVDTHVHRISNRLGLVSTRNPDETERELRGVLPEDLWIGVNDLMVTFGQNLCHPTSPRCSRCPVSDRCSRVGVTRSR